MDNDLSNEQRKIAGEMLWEHLTEAKESGQVIDEKFIKMSLEQITKIVKKI